MFLINQFFGQSFNTITSHSLPLLQHLSIGRGLFLSIVLYMLPFSGFIYLFIFIIKLTKTCGWSKLLIIVVFLTFLYVEDETSSKL